MHDNVLWKYSTLTTQVKCMDMYKLYGKSICCFVIKRSFYSPVCWSGAIISLSERRMTPVFTFTFQLMAAIVALLGAAEAEYYIVLPTDPLSSAVCPTNNSCPSDKVCQTMDDYARNSSLYFSPNKSNITLYFMCGLHRCTEQLVIHDLEIVVMQGTPISGNVIIQMPVNASHNFSWIFSNVSTVHVKNITFKYPLVTIKNVINFTVESAYCHGNENATAWGGVSSNISIIQSHAVIIKSSLNMTCLLRVKSFSTLIVKDCNFTSYSHQACSCIFAETSTVVLSGNVKFSNNSLTRWGSVGGAICMNYTSCLNISKGSNVVFQNNRNLQSSQGGALFLSSCTMNIMGNVTFLNNSSADKGGAITLGNTTMNINRDANVWFTNNTSTIGGAMSSYYCSINITGSNVFFMSNAATLWGGALHSENSNINVSEYANLSFIHNTASTQGQGGAMLVTAGTFNVERHSNLLIANNSAYQGGGLYLYSAYMQISINTVMYFANNTASDVGGAIYALVRPNFPCLYVVGYVYYHGLNNSTVEFDNNMAGEGIGEHIYGGSIRSTRCNFILIDMFSYFNTSVCEIKHPSVHFKFKSSSNQTLSNISSESQRVCGCDSNGNLQCTILSAIFVKGISTFPGDTFNISVAIVGFDFGTTVGTVHANFLAQNGSKAQMETDQWNQWIKDAKCSHLRYTVYSKNQYEILYLQSAKNSVTTYGNISSINTSISYFLNTTCIRDNLLTTPVFINITILPCPPGFYLPENQSHPRCDCYPVLIRNSFECKNIGYISWNSTMWVNATFNGNKGGGVIYNKFCPVD